MSFPPAHMLVAVGAAEVVRAAAPLPRWRAWATAAALAVAPDLDIALGILLGERGEYHGTFTHSLLAVAVVGVVAWGVAGRKWGVLAAAGYGSHLLVDLLDDRGETNVLLGWPFTMERPLAIARIFPDVPFEHGEGIRGAAMSLFQPEVMERLLVQTAAGAVFCVALLGIAAGVRRARRFT